MSRIKCALAALLFGAASLALPGPAQVGLTLNVDIPNETVLFTGSDDGVPEGAGPYFTLRWEYGSGTGNLG